jgi:hypothetical protein
MQLTRAVWEQIANLLAADVATLAAALANKVKLAKANFTPSLDLGLAALTEATFPGYLALNAGTGPQLVYYDVATGLLTIELLEPAGGFHWESTAPPAPAETIYGVYVTDNAGAVLLGEVKFVTPLTINAANQGIDVANLQLKFATSSPS